MSKLNQARFWAALVLAVAGILFLALIGTAAQTEDVFTGLATVNSTPWGKVTLADLSLGLFLVAAWMVALNGWKHAFPWLIGLLLLGNLATLVFLLLRLRSCHDLRTLLLQPRRPR